MSDAVQRAPLAGVSVVVLATGVAATYAGRILGTLGAQTLLVELPSGSPLRQEPPFLPNEGAHTKNSALFSYLTAGMQSEIMDLTGEQGRSRLNAKLAEATIFLFDLPMADRVGLGLDEVSLATRFPDLIAVSVLPFGAYGDKSGWSGGDLITQHASGEGFLLPNGLAVELFPDRAPLKIGGNFGAYQGGIAAALGAVSALWARPKAGGQLVDVSNQDAMLAVGAFAIQRLGDGSIEHRVERSFRYGGVIPCQDGYLELLTLEQRQWDGLVELLGRPEWALDPSLDSSIERGRRGPEINQHIRDWASVRNVDDIVASGQKLGVPLARYKTPSEILAGEQEAFRGLFQSVAVGESSQVDMLVSPYHIDGKPLEIRSGPPALIETLEVAS